MREGDLDGEETLLFCRRENSGDDEGDERAWGDKHFGVERMRDKVD